VISWIASHDSQRSLADMNRAVKLSPRGSLYYALRGFLLARDLKVVPACRDFALFVLTYEPSQYTFSMWVIDWEGPQGLRISLGCLGAVEKGGSPLLWSPAGWGSGASCTIDRQDHPTSSGTSAP
jgi:hypothetical protein